MIPLTGPISLGGLRTELGLTGAISLGGTTKVRRLAGKTSGPIKLSDARGATYIGSNANSVNLHSSAGSPSAVGTYRFYISEGVTIGATYPNAALGVGDFADGSTVVIDNYGSVLGFGGRPNGGAGGIAIWADYANQTMVVNNFGNVYGGGGAGGKGGNGGQGGQGGPGVWYSQNIQYNGDSFRWTWFQSDGGSHLNSTTAKWNGGIVYQVTGGEPTSGNGYYRGSLQSSWYTPSDGKSTGYWTRNYTIFVYVPNYTTGGAGGAGGAGGNGGYGQGSDVSQSGGAAGAGGSPGSAGGTNAGSGGYGGTGGYGGWGGGWGAAGNAGGTGNTGATGNPGNNGGGYAGSAGAGGAAGGNPGYYLYRNGRAVTFNNSGNIAGWNG